MDELPEAAALGLCTGGTEALVGELVAAAVTESCAVACAGAGAGLVLERTDLLPAEQLLQLRWLVLDQTGRTPLLQWCPVVTGTSAGFARNALSASLPCEKCRASSFSIHV